MNIKIRHDYVLVRLEQNSNDATGIHLDQDYDKNKHLSVYGTVMAVPDKLRYTGREAHEVRKVKSRSFRQQAKLVQLNAHTLDYDVDMEVQVGDEVWLEYTGVIDAKDKGLVFEDKILVRYDCIVVARRDEQIIPVNGHLLVEQIDEPDPIHISRPVQKLTNKAKVLHVGSPVKHYKFYANHKECDDIEVGDTIRHRKKAAIPLEMPLYQKLDKPYSYLQRKYVLCKETT